MKTLIKPVTPAGTRDFLPQEMAKQNYMLEQMKRVFLSFGYETIQTPVLEYARNLQGKYGKENSKRILTFRDPFGRNLAFRYDQTVPFARFVAAQHPLLPMPFKRYQISRVWRKDKRAKQYSEFYQCDIDIIGTDHLLAECEIIKVIATVMENLRIGPFLVKINSRRKRASDEILKLMRLAENFKIPDGILKFDSKLAPEIGYYTGLIFQVVLPNLDLEEICTGGRYHDLCSAFGEQTFSGVGAAFRLDRLMQAMEKSGFFKELGLSAEVLVTHADPSTLIDSLKIFNELQKAGIRSEIYFDPKPLAEQIKYALAKKIPFAVICKPSGAQRAEAIVKILKTGKEKTIPQIQIVAYLKGYTT